VKDADVTDFRAYNLHSTALVNAAAFPPITGVYGISILNSQNVNLTRCNVEDSTCLPPDQDGFTVGDIYGALLEGFVLAGDLPTKNIKMVDCHMSDLIGTRRALGIVGAQQVSQVHVEGLTMQNVSLLDETVPAASRAAVELIGVGGLGTPEKFTFTKCDIQDVPIGFSILGAKDIVIQKTNIVGLNTEESLNRVGIRLQQFFFGSLGSNIVVEDCVITRFKSPNPDDGRLPFAGTGINVRSEENQVYGVNLRRKKATLCSVGILLRSNDVGHNVVDQNELAFNDVVGLLNTSFDATEPPLTKDLISRNLAYHNGSLVTPQYPGGSQYAINTGNGVNQVLFQANQMSPFPNTESTLSNLDLQP
jgi:hypothetical protein